MLLETHQGSVAFDFDMLFTFKPLPAWQRATQGKSAMNAFEAAGRERLIWCGQAPAFSERGRE
jgi:hypothetical protein